MTERWYVLQSEEHNDPAFFVGGRYATPSLKEAKKFRTRTDAESLRIWVTKNFFPAKIVQIEIRVVSEDE
jgi:hypothetical protein